MADIEYLAVAVVRMAQNSSLAAEVRLGSDFG
jgi:hypothetical protein